MIISHQRKSALNGSGSGESAEGKPQIGIQPTEYTENTEGFQSAIRNPKSAIPLSCRLAPMRRVNYSGRTKQGAE